ncbi:oxidoreductase [Leptospira congkakensis]|uniref:Oxidoreductase n=1 Tax=Leptospira congkakensis TaxID=2484932 RepID=A0A4Z1AJU2_9LEPT|nr:thioredoxin domain-containing protein [Leptospira congkakensis]TGL87132.1 oxidoreductase [Leptospira congkakensis]TGL96700.1 oxidoreductase [Leptospira congkakensis]TGL97549.1 oxidoreductase [Leptospira congkakensis]
MPFIFFIILFFSCEESPRKDVFLPESLPSEETIKLSLSSDSHLAKLQSVAKSEGRTLTAWKERERSLVTDEEISKFWTLEKKSLPREVSDTDSIDRLRESIRIRIVWSRIFHRAGVQWKEKSFEIGRNELLKKISIKNSPKFGSLDAKWVIVEWSDYLCNFCRDTFPHTQNILKKYKSQILYVHKDFPLDSDSEEGLLPLAMGRCLWKRDSKNFPLHMQLLYGNSKKITRNENIKVAEWESLTECQSKELKSKYFALVKDDLKEAAAFGVSSVPTFWVNGRWIVGGLNAETWERVLKDTMSP